MLMILDSKEEIEKKVEGIKLAMLSFDMTTAKVNFPEYFHEDVIDYDTPEGQAAIASGASEDYSEVVWESPSNNPQDMEEFLRLNEALADSSHISLGG